MRKIHVNGSTDIRTLSPFAYKDRIKSLETSNEARVTVDGVKVAVSCVTSGRDVKAHTGMKYHLYFWADAAAAKACDTAKREFLPITKAEFDEYRGNPASTFAIVTVKPIVATEAAPAAPATEATEQPAPPAAVARKGGKKAQREAAAA